MLFLFYGVLIAHVPFLFGIWDRMWNSIISSVPDQLYTVCLGPVMGRPAKTVKKFHLALFSLRTESDNPDATCELSP